MASSGEEYLIAHRKKLQKRLRILTWVSILSFCGSGLLAVVSTLLQAIQNPHFASKASADSILKQHAKGYEIVLQREPNNLVALEGLVHVRLQLGDVRGAIPSLEKLVKQEPENQEYKALLKKLKEQTNQGDRQTISK